MDLSADTTDFDWGHYPHLETDPNLVEGYVDIYGSVYDM